LAIKQRDGIAAFREVFETVPLQVVAALPSGDALWYWVAPSEQPRRFSLAPVPKSGTPWFIIREERAHRSWIALKAACKATDIRAIRVGEQPVVLPSAQLSFAKCFSLISGFVKSPDSIGTRHDKVEIEHTLFARFETPNTGWLYEFMPRVCLRFQIFADAAEIPSVTIATTEIVDNREILDLIEQENRRWQPDPGFRLVRHFVLGRQGGSRSLAAEKCLLGRGDLSALFQSINGRKRRRN
jgi:hypothetical protein